MGWCCDRAFVLEQIQILKDALAANALATVETRKQFSYSLDTGQTRQSVQRQQLSQLKSERDGILAELSYWNTILCGGGAHTAIPGW